MLLFVGGGWGGLERPRVCMMDELSEILIDVCEIFSKKYNQKGTKWVVETT